MLIALNAQKLRTVPRLHVNKEDGVATTAKLFEIDNAKLLFEFVAAKAFVNDEKSVFRHCHQSFRIFAFLASTRRVRFLICTLREASARKGCTILNDGGIKRLFSGILHHRIVNSL